MKDYLFYYWLKKSRSSQLGFKNCLKHSTVKYLSVFYALMALLTPIAQAKVLAGESLLKVTFDPPAEDQPQASTGGASR